MVKKLDKKTNLISIKQKNRFRRKIKFVNFVNGDVLILNSQEGFLELRQIKNFRRILKRFFYKRNKFAPIKRVRVWSFIRINYFLQQKAKNSRMGKGKGNFKRKIVILRQNATLFEIKGVAFYKIKWLLFKLNKRTRLTLRAFFKKKQFFKNWFMNRRFENRFFYNKYLYM